ncbi:MAG TPA: ELWxxDGT repeat protein [Thermoanaerobaculia bacterium]|nr:ELWxxDGT repeat protein [Thermoanaerobaculia bacterium]
MRLFATVLLAAAAGLHAQTPYLVKDINTTVSADTESSSPRDFIAYGGRTYFVATTPAEGPELWRTDGSGGGTALVADIIPGSSGSSPTLLAVVNGLLLFNARTVDHGLELWATDGSAAGTRRVLDINPGPNSSTPAARFPQGSRMLFSADDGTNGRELWVTDGTAGGTRMVKDLNPGSAGSTPAYLTAFNGSTYFAAAGGLWKTDGTDAGTIKVASVSARGLRAAGNRLFFEGFTSATGYELWVSDGTEGGTRMVTEIAPGTTGAMPANFFGFMAVLGDRVVFAANDGVRGRELWISDGTAAGTRLLRDLVPGPAGRWDQDSLDLIAFGNRVFFTAAEAEHGLELWSTDGTESGTALFADLEPGKESSAPYRFSVAGGKLFFAAGISLSGSRLWVVDALANGARVVSSSSGQPVAMAGGQEAGGTFYFAGSTSLHGTEPWVSDGTDAGTSMVANIAPDGAPSSNPQKLTAANGLLFFTAYGDRPYGDAALWRSDGTEGGTFKLREGGEFPTILSGAGSILLLRGYYGELMASDGTVEGTISGEAFRRRFGGFDVEELFPFGDTIFARVEDRGTYETTLWKTTGALHAPAIALGGPDPGGLTEFAGRWIFSAEERSAYDRALWITDGTPAGTVPVVPRIGGGLGLLATASGSIFYVAGKEGEQKTYLWKSDGTLGGTSAVREVMSGAREIQGAGRNVFMVLERGVWDHVLWVSDGTAEGTLELMDVQDRFPDEDRLTPIGNRVVFTQRYQSGVYELWGSDGTKSGTVALMKGLSLPPQQREIDGIVYFAGRDDAHGTELWATDGTVEGTRMLFDLNPGPASSWPREFVRVGEAIYFQATTAATGAELWALPLGEPRLSIADARVAEAEGGVARVAVTLSSAQPRSVTVEYTTADRTASAGSDYDSASGTLTFAPGQTSRTIDVRVHGDAAVENNETFFVTLRNAGGARIVRGEAVAIVEDDDQAADLSVAATFLESGGSLYDGATVSNAGPSPARDISVHITMTPEDTYTGCRDCTIPQLLNGASAFTAGNYFPQFVQSYRSAIATARDADPRMANNAASWTLSVYQALAMTPAFLTPGGTGKVTAMVYNTPGTPAVTSSDPSVLTVVPGMTRDGNRITFDVSAVKPGTSTLTVAGTQYPLLVTVVAAGTTPRWPGGLTIRQKFFVRTLEKPLLLELTPSGEAPLTGATATGTVTLTTSGGQELVRHTIRGSAPVEIPVWFRTVGATSFTIAYSGDANFLPQTEQHSVFVQPGKVSITGGLAPLGGGSYELNAFVEGSPVVLPTGTLVVKSGGTEVARVALQPSTGGRAKGAITLNNLPASPSVVVEYSGDAQYAAATQQMRLAAPRRRSAHQ